jgi:hypothetical protein
MLCQLVCTDRRYARMNCFNIRELQGILKRKFFTDLVNTHEHRNLMDKTMIGLRYKSNANSSLDNDMLSFYNFGISSQSTNQHATLTSLTSVVTNSRPITSTHNEYLISLFSNSNTAFFSRVIKFFSAIFSDVSMLPLHISFYSLSNVFKPQVFSQTLLNNFNFLNFSFNEFSFTGTNANNASVGHIFFTRKETGLTFNLDEFKHSLSESSNSQRFTRFSSSLINYDYKTGHYIGNWDAQYPFLFTSFIEVARGIRKPS